MCIGADDQIRDLLGPSYHIAHQRTREQGSGISIASRWPIVAVEELDLHVTPRTGTFPSAALITQLDAPRSIGPLLFVNHFPNWELAHEYERERQGVIAARRIENLISEREIAHVIVTGDFDAAPDASSLRFWTGKHALEGTSVCYRDAWSAAHPNEPGETFTPRNPLVTDWDWPFRRIDYVLVRCGIHGGPTLQVSACELAFAEPVDGVWASDHFGVVADLDPPRRESFAA